MRELLKKMDWIDYRDRINWNEIGVDLTAIIIVIIAIVLSIEYS